MATPTLPTPTSLSDNTFHVSISFGCLGNSRKVSSSAIEIQDTGDSGAGADNLADKTLFRVSKQLLDSPELAAIHKHDGATRSWLMNICLPSLFRSGIYLMPYKALDMVDTYLTAAAQKRTELIEKFLAVYETRRDQAQARLSSQFNPMDYPPITQVRAAFTFDWSYMNYSTPGKLKELNPAIFKAEQEKAAARMQEATQEITLLMRANLKDMVDHMVDKLTPDEDGKPKRFKASSVTKLSEFLKNFDIRNVTNDQELEAIVNMAKQLLNGVDAANLRESDQTRFLVTQGFTLLKGKLDGMVEEAGPRKIVFEPEPEEAEEVGGFV